MKKAENSTTTKLIITGTNFMIPKMETNTKPLINMNSIGLAYITYTTATTIMNIGCERYEYLER